MRSWHSDEKPAGEASPAGNDEESNKITGDESKAKKAEENSLDILEADPEEASSPTSENIVEELCDDDTSPGAQKFECVACDFFFVLIRLQLSSSVSSFVLIVRCTRV